MFAETKDLFAETKIKRLALKIQEERELKCRIASGCTELRAPGIETTTRQGLSSRRRQRRTCAARSWGRDGGCRATTGRLMVLSWRMMRFWYSASVAAHATLKRMSQNDEANIAFHVCLRAGWCDMGNLSASMAQP